MRLVEGSAKLDGVLRWFRQHPEARKLKLVFNYDSGAFDFPERELGSLTDLLNSNGLPFRLEPRKDYFW